MRKEGVNTGDVWRLSIGSNPAADKNTTNGYTFDIVIIGLALNI